MTDSDPVQEGGGDEDLYDVSTWEERTVLDSLSVGVYRGLKAAVKVSFVLMAALILIAELGVAVYVTYLNPSVGVLTILSVVPAFGLAAYIWYADVTFREPLLALVATFLLAVVFASFAAVTNTLLQPYFTWIPFVGAALYFFLVVGPVEETVKFLAVRSYAYNNGFNAVIDGVVYGAAAGLGFATIENSIYITNAFLASAQLPPVEQLRVVLATASQRSFVGPGHVIFSGIMGFYLGLARFNRDDAGPIVVKGLLIASFLHATYNTVVTYVPLGLTGAVGLIAVILVYDGVVGYYLYRKVSRYRRAYALATE